tara:strand:+ start:2133 stop:2402 length:270 start_codon:yes stop_codon:yes gene_type:complete
MQAMTKPKPIASTAAQLLERLNELIDHPILADLVEHDGMIYSLEGLHTCDSCGCHSLQEDITDGLCEPCHEGEAEYADQRGLSAMVRQL